MTTATHDFMPGNLVRARGREWVVQAHTQRDSRQDDGGGLLRLRPLGGADEDIITLIGLNDHLQLRWVAVQHKPYLDFHRQRFSDLAQSA